MTTVAYQKHILTRRWRKVHANEPSEFQIQIALIARLRLQARRDCIYYHVPNGGWRDRREAAKLKAMGVLPGVADLVFIWPGTMVTPRIMVTPRVLFLELKARGRNLTVEQLHFRERARLAGADFETADTIDDAVGILKSYGILP